jgi:hypothetical protein
MASPIPKDPEQRRRRNKPPEFDELPAEGFQGTYPPLPGAYRTLAEDDGTSIMVDYLSETRKWYDVMAHSPMATRFTDFDWLRLQQCAPLVDRYYRHPSQTLAAELRLQQAQFGGSPTDRQKMRWRIAQPADDDAMPSPRARRADPRLRIVGE